MIGSTLGHFKITEEIGRGGMGVVYRATDVRLHREVAIKVLDPELAPDRERRRRLIREARTAAGIDHPNVATILELGEAEGQPFVAMELVRGSNMRALLREGPLDPERTVSIITDVCHGLASAHELGIIHRDLKPENIAITDKQAVKILDFGIARFRQEIECRIESETAETVTALMPHAGGIAGTLGYMSPEQASGRPVDARSDIFSIGVVLFEALTGSRPFRGETPTEIIAAILKDSPVPVRELRKGIDPRLARIVERCLAKDPADRFQTVDELRQALGHLGARSIAIPGRLALTAALGVVVVMALIAGWTWLGGRGEPTPPADDLLSVVVAPFSKVGEGPADRGSVIRELIEQQIRGRSDAAFLRLVEGVLDDAVESDESAREVGKRVGADAVCWGSVLGLGEESEIEARITLVQPIEVHDSSVMDAGLLFDPEATREITRTMPLGGPRQLALLRSQASEVADLVTTLSGLALLKVGEHERAARTLAKIENPTADQSYYQALAHLRQGDTAEAGRILSGVLEKHPRHVGARLGMMMIRSEDPLWSTPDSELIADLREDLTSEPSDSSFERLWLLLVILMRNEADAEPIVELLELVERFCKEETFAGLSVSQRRTLMVIVVFAGMGNEDPRIRETKRRLFATDALERELASYPGMLDFLCAGRFPYPGCAEWIPDPYNGDPITYIWYHIEREDDSLLEGDSLLAVAAADPRLDKTVADWLLFASETESIEEILDWSKENRASGAELGRQYLSEGIMLHRNGFFERAEEAYLAAGEILGDDPTLVRFRGTNLMAADRIDEAIDVMEKNAVPELALALAAVGRLREAYRQLAPSESTVADGGAEPVAVSQEAPGPTVRELTDWIMGRMRSSDAGNLARIMDSMVREIEGDAIVGAAVSRRLRREIAEAAASALIDLHRGFRFGEEEGIRWTTSYNPSVSYELPRDPLELLAFLEALPQSEAGTDDPITREEVALFVRNLSDLLRDEIERLEPAAAGR
jgi:tRNA A-37 threonylcarbamoyl transferase component Bud32/tetratricopeptide (TPR) repeat protein